MSDQRPSEALNLKALRKEWIRDLRRKLRRGDAVGDLTGWIARFWDELLQSDFMACLGGLTGECALFALGGYGRREMAPFSDVDIMVVVPDDAQTDLLSSVERFIRGLWAAGITLGHSVRTPDECFELVSRDLSTATSVLDARFIAGNAKVFPNPQQWTVETVDAAPAWEAVNLAGRVGFVASIRQGVEVRREKYGDTPHLLEPHVKLGRGGLRDVHAIDWTARLLYGTRGGTGLAEGGWVSSEEASRLETARAFLLRTRIALHCHHGWKQDQLTYEAQSHVAAMLGFGEMYVADSLNRFMQSYYVHARRVVRLTNLWLAEWALDLSAPDNSGEENRDWLTLDNPEALLARPQHIFGVLARAQREEQRLHPAVRRVLNQSAERLPREIAGDAEANRAVRKVICDLDDAGHLLEVVADSGLLGRVVPEWGHLVGHAVPDVYHVYTTDTHLLGTCDRIKRLLRGDLEETYPYMSRVAARYRTQRDPSALILAALVHDIGKGTGGDHSIIGAGMGAEIARRMGFSSADRSLVHFLVLEHLTLTKVSQRRDIHDRSTLQALCRKVREEEQLDALAILSLADMDSIAPAPVSAWKRHLLVELHRAATDFIGRVSSEVHVEGQSLELLRELLLNEMSAERVDALMSLLPNRFLLGGDVPQLMRVARLLADGVAESRVAFKNVPDKSFTEVMVLDPKYPGQLAKVAGVIDAAGLDVRKATSLPLRRVGTLDVFIVCTADRAHGALDERRWDALRQQIVQVLSGEGSIQDFLRVRESRLPPRKRPDVKISVTIDNQFDRHYSILEVKAADHAGLLAHLAQCLVDLELVVNRSIITTEGNRAIDTFYVTSPNGEKLVGRTAGLVVQTIRDRMEALSKELGG